MDAPARKGLGAVGFQEATAAPVAGSSLARRREDTPPIEVKSPAT
jgi:hypothetical protein